MRLPFKLACLLLTGIPAFCAAAAAKPLEGAAAPVFSLTDTNGKQHDLATAANTMMIVYFFNAESRPSVEGLLSLNELAIKYKNADLAVWAVTASPKKKADEFVRVNRLAFPVLLDTGKVSDAYGARMILPTVCILGPGRKVIDYFQGGGTTTNVMLVRLAERKLQQRELKIAEAISDSVIRKSPDNVKAKMTKGYAALKAGRLKEAEKIFAGLSKGKGISEVIGKEGLAAVYAARGNSEMALKLADEVEKLAPERVYASLIRADILYSKNMKAKAGREYSKAAGKKEGEPFQKAVALNKMGRLYAGAGDYKSSRELYDKAVEMDPYYVEAMTNKGITYEREGDYSRALEIYRYAGNVLPKGTDESLAKPGTVKKKEKDDVISVQSQVPNIKYVLPFVTQSVAEMGDAYTKVLARNAQGMIDLQKEADRMDRIDGLVDELAERYRETKDEPATKEVSDSWTSTSTILAFVNIEEKGVLGERDGMAEVLVSQLADSLNESGRVKVADRMIMDKLLGELNLGSSELTDKDTSLRLGKIMAARIIGTGTIVNMQDRPSMVSLKLIDSETAGIKDTVRSDVDFDSGLDEGVGRINRDVLVSIVRHYPLKGYVVSNDEGKVMINIGSEQGVVKGTIFEVLEEQGDVEYKGKKLQKSPKAVGEIEVTGTEPGLAYARILAQKKPIAKDSMVSEKAGGR